MNKEETKINFDLSTLSLNELIKVYEDIVEFIQFLDEKKIVVEEKVEESNE
ncbi:MAG: hypothetical protein PHH04_08740 [Thomasclavelia sp.]|nr:hypothetical protein [Thomasclavelia sp.]